MFNVVEIEGIFYRGLCYCGFVKYIVWLDFIKLFLFFYGVNVIRCNCCVCFKMGIMFIDFGDDGLLIFIFLILGEKDFGMYVFDIEWVRWFFCFKCSIIFYNRVYGVFEGVEVCMFRVNVLMLDERVDGLLMEDLKNFKIKYWDFKGVELFEVFFDEFVNGGVW